MKIQLLVSRAGPAGAYSPGDVIEVSDVEAKRMFEADPPQAVPVRDGVSPEFAAFDRNGDGRPGGANRPNRKSGKKI
ncbi:hypothetical protein GRZ55_11620 [Chelativorans sp. ZYF759]|uniref:hypothetical protein n=1 Tax=Chelativorans sp. ZYF759 TaxID=2692213 RepID=UPI00145D0756|nr:hypothetical protein [Chelativorans sp. ZYF759]NMG39892.1 hypothetical protein [Chelativorans sp. ZYF759]